MGYTGVDWIELAPVTVQCLSHEHSNEPSGYLKEGILLDE
jgi:hypothetical protein